MITREYIVALINGDYAILEDEKSVFILENQLISENDCCLQTAIFICFLKNQRS